jgi:hypothetical protein
LTEGSEMYESYVRDELFDKAMEVGEFEVFPMPAELDGDPGQCLPGIHWDPPRGS